MPQSAKSNGSKQSKGSRAVYTKKSEVDEALFGSKKGAQGEAVTKPAVVISREEIRTIKQNMFKGKQADAILIKESELQRIKDSAKVIDKQQEAEEKKRMMQERQREREAAELLKTKMKTFDQTRPKKLPIATYQKDAENNETMLTKAQKAMDEELDDVKEMNNMVRFAKCATIRKRQLEEAKELEVLKKKDDQKMDTMMEVERLKALQFHEQREKLQKEVKREGALVIVDQIRDREYQRIRQQELKDKEQVQMQRQIKALQEEEVRAQEMKVIRAKELMESVKQANKASIAVKEKKVLEEKEFDRQIAEYNKKKAEREEEYQEELKRMHDEKEKEIQKLREKQQRAINKQAEIDELNAKRAFEANERRIKQQEKREEEDRAKKVKELQDAREQQEMEKARVLAEQIKKDRDEFMRVIKKQKEAEAAEKLLEEERKKVFLANSVDVRIQMAKNAERKMLEKRETEMERERLKALQDEERLKLERIKREKLHELDQLGVPDEYKIDLKNKKIP